MSEESVTSRLRRIRQLAQQVFEDEEDAKEWLDRPNPALEGEKPIVLAETKEGEERVRTALGRIEYGVYT